MPEKITAQMGDKQVIIETGKLAKQADGAVTVQLGETIVVVAAVAATKAKAGQEFFPLTVDYREKAAAAGRFPGGYFKREGRPTEKEILTCRLTDRPIRPLFPRGWYNEVQVQSIVLSADGENDPDILSIIGASTALMISDIPWAGPLGAVRVGRLGGKLVANPTHGEMKESDLDLVYVGNATDIVMYEGSAKEISEADFNAALKFGQEAIQPVIAAQQELVAKVGRKKREITLNVAPDEVLQEAKKLVGDRFVPALLTPGKLAREGAVKAIQDEVGAKLVEKFGAEKVTDFIVKDAFYYIQKEAAASGSMAARLMSSARFPARWAFCRAHTARRFSPAAKPRPSRSSRSAPATTCRNSIPTPAATAKRNSSCTTTSRTSPSARPAASPAPGGARSATARSPNAASNRCCR